MAFFLYATIVLLILVSLFLVMIILIQKGRGGGLASAFGGGGGNTAFGSKTGDVLTWATSVVFGVFLLLCVTLNLLGNKWDESKKAPAVGAPPPAGLPANSQPPGPESSAPVGTPTDQPVIPPVNSPEPK